MPRPTPRVELAKELAAQLVEAGVTATHDPRKAENSRPCALLTPPTLDYANGTYDGPAITWRLALLSSHAAGTVEAWAQLDGLLDQVDQVLNIERAEAASYALAEGAGPIPAYLATFTT